MAVKAQIGTTEEVDVAESNQVEMFDLDEGEELLLRSSPNFIFGIAPRLNSKDTKVTGNGIRTALMISCMTKPDPMTAESGSCSF